MRNFFPGLFNLMIALVGFKSFKRKRKKLMEKYKL
jgi:hypothetical protein